MEREIILGLVLGVVSGLISTIIIFLLVERHRRASLDFQIAPSREHPLTDGISTRIHLYVQVHNKRLRRPLSSIYDREPALMCRAWIKFMYRDETEVYSLEMVGRWANTPEPFRWGPNGQIIVHESFSRDWMDIAPATSELLDIASKSKDEDICYGWNNQTYGKPELKNTDWQLDKGRYIVQIRVKTGGREFKKRYQLINEMDFRLEEI